MNRSSKTVLSLLALATAVTLTACSPTSPDAVAPEPSATASAPAATSAPGANPYGHVHGLAVEPGSGRVLLATHNGLFGAADDAAQRTGPQIDLMGFTAENNGTLYASGHPGPDTGIADPAGLLRSTDGGETWEVVSREGQSDFHALAAAGGGFVAFDGQLWTSDDGRSWDSVSTGPAPYALAGSSSGTVLATTEQGVWTSGDGGRSWTEPGGGPVLLVVSFADEDTAVGVEPDGTVHTSEDAGRSWSTAGTVGIAPAAITARSNAAGTLEVWIAGGDGTVVHSADGGEAFGPWAGEAGA